MQNYFAEMFSFFHKLNWFIEKYFNPAKNICFKTIQNANKLNRVFQASTVTYQIFGGSGEQAK